MPLAHVPEVILVVVDSTFARQQMKRCDAQIVDPDKRGDVAIVGSTIEPRVVEPLRRGACQPGAHSGHKSFRFASKNL
jgi:hypothetical protein